MNTEEKYQSAIEAINAASGTPFPITKTLIAIIKEILSPEDLDLIIAFSDQKSQTMDQLKQSSGLPESEILKKVESLAKKGVIFNQPNRKGVMVYRLLPLVNVGTFEYMFMKKLAASEQEKKIARMFSRLFTEVDGFVQSSYEAIQSFAEQAPPIDRTVPVLENKPKGEKIVIHEDLGPAEQRPVPAQKVEELIEKFDEIAVGHCFCRHYRDLIGDSCKQTKLRETCFTFGKSARYTSEQGFSRMISRQDALQILKRSEEDGLVHKAYHPNFDITKDETSICNCCKCCCMQAKDNLIGPTINATLYIAEVNLDLCSGCGICAPHCHSDAIVLNPKDKTVLKIEDSCIGCGVCAYFCPENAIRLAKKERLVRFLPERKEIKA